MTAPHDSTLTAPTPDPSRSVLVPGRPRGVHLATNLGPLAQLRAGRLGRRLPQLLLGLFLYGFSLALIVRGAVGLAPWDVLHLGLAAHLPISLGTALVGASIAVLLLWIPLREKPGLGTIANAVLVGVFLDVGTWLVPAGPGWVARIALMLGGIVLNGVASAMYIGAQLGRGPRDGLMTGLARVTGAPMGLIRIGLEVAVVIVGVILGGGLHAGGLGVGTVLYAVLIGPLTASMLPWFAVRLDEDGLTAGSARAAGQLK